MRSQLYTDVNEIDTVDRGFEDINKSITYINNNSRNVASMLN